jgi:hypothetical protein
MWWLIHKLLPLVKVSAFPAAKLDLQRAAEPKLNLPSNENLWPETIENAEIRAPELSICSWVLQQTFIEVKDLLHKYFKYRLSGGLLAKLPLSTYRTRISADFSRPNRPY